MASQLTACHWIDGEWVDSPQRAQSIDPATGEPIGTYTEASGAEAKRAIAAALRAFRDTDWRADRRLRAKVINEIADRFEARARPVRQHLLSRPVWYSLLRPRAQ